MERKKCKILNHFEEIIEEKTTLENNLRKVINQVFSLVDYIIFFSGEIKQKDCSLILKHELGVLKKLTEINCELEDIIEQSPLEQLKISEKRYESGTNLVTNNENSLGQLKTIKEKIEEHNENILTQIKPEQQCEESKKVPEHEESIQDLKSYTIEVANCVSGLDEEHSISDSADKESNTIACSSTYISELISEDYNAETENHFSDADIQYLRDTLKKFSEKLGLNAESISSMKDYYEKPSTSCKIQVFDVPSSNHNLRNSISDVSHKSFEETTGNEFEIPEKDTNVASIHKAGQAEDCDALLTIESISNVSLESSESILNDIITESHNLVEHISSNNLQCNNVSNSKILSSDTDLLCGIKNDDNSSQGSDAKVHSLCSSEAADLNNDLISFTAIDNAKTEVSLNESKKIVYTALEKLNNTKFNDRRDPILQTFKQQDIPDLKLRPAESQVIKNDFEASSKSKKKKNKKKNGKEKEKDDVIYELKPKPTPKVGMDCAFSHVESPNEFYIHVVDEESTVVDALTEQINEYFQDSVSEYESKEEAHSCIGTYCFAFISEYNGWYRTQILDWYLDNKSDDVLLQLVDFGNTRRTSYKNVRKMNKDMAAIHMLAIRCHLPLMYPPHSTFLNRLSEWPPETIDAIADLSGLFQNETKIFKIVYAHEEGDSLAVDLYNQEDEDPEHTVGQILLDLGLAVQIIDDPDTENLEMEEYLQDVDSLEEADNINEAIMGYDPRDEARICRFTKKDGTCYKGKNCKLEHRPLSKDGFTTDTEPVFKEAMYDLLLPTNGDIISILISGYKDPCNFFAQIIRKPHKDKRYTVDKDLYALLGSMNLPKTVRTFESFKIPPAIGEIVSVKHWSNRWLRAVVRERIMSDDEKSEKYQVFTLDFGDCVQVPLSDLRKIKPHFLELPFQAVECYIAKYKMKKDCDMKKAEKFFCQNIFFRNFVAVAIRSEALPLKIGITGYNGDDVGKILAENGFVEERVCDKNPIDGCPLELY